MADVRPAAPSPFGIASLGVSHATKLRTEKKQEKKGRTKRTASGNERNKATEEGKYIRGYR
jgi:hypothetical protein